MKFIQQSTHFAEQTGRPGFIRISNNLRGTLMAARSISNLGHGTFFLELTEQFLRIKGHFFVFSKSWGYVPSVPPVPTARKGHTFSRFLSKCTAKSWVQSQRIISLQLWWFGDWCHISKRWASFW